MNPYRKIDHFLPISRSIRVHQILISNLYLRYKDHPLLPQYTSSSLRNYIENPRFDRSSPSSLDGSHLSRNHSRSWNWIILSDEPLGAV